MVWIHGGGFLTGNGYDGFYGGAPLVAIGDVILVTINYRLSTFGFITTGRVEVATNVYYVYTYVTRGFQSIL